MKYLIIVICFIYGVFGYSQYTAIPDPNFENYLEQNGMGDGVPNNGQVLTANIENVTELVIFGMGIQDLTGIQDFAAVELINCSFNTIPTLDVSQNMNLAGLGCESSSITELFLPPTPTLTILNCAENFLTELDVSQNPGLEQLYCQFNFLTSLNLANNISLELIFSAHNNISGFLDTSQNPALSSLSVGYNDITELDLASNIALLSLGASSNPILSLDARNGNNENIISFVVTETTGDLDCILVDDASATYLDDWLKDPETTFVNNQQECDALGVRDMDSHNFTMYPNPTNEIITINLLKTASYMLFDSNSKNIKNGELVEGNNLISVEGLDAGVYFLKVYTDKEVITKKLVVY
tara:strand:+ start:7366 stop:8430 length:1065 start_codon:yes stop_codon:yes gene_type:complete